MDPLSEVLRSVRLTGGVFLDAQFTAPWCVTSQMTAEDCNLLMAAPAQQVIGYHVVVKGRLQVSVEGEPPIEVSAGEIIFYDPKVRLEEAQYKSCMVQAIDGKKWGEVVDRLMNLENIFSLGFSRENSHLTALIDGNLETITPESFRWILPKGELEGYH